MSWIEIKHAVNTSLGTGSFKPLNTQIAELDTKTSAIAASTLLQYGSTVKSIQRGVMSFTSQMFEQTYNIVIGTINPAKTIVLLNGAAGYGTTYDSPFIPHIVSLAANLLVVGKLGINPSRTAVMSWQVVEFY